MLTAISVWRPFGDKEQFASPVLDSPELDSTDLGSCFNYPSWNVGHREDFECRGQPIHSSGAICVVTFLDEFGAGCGEATAFVKARDEPGLFDRHGAFSGLTEKVANVNGWANL
jgi:hypothetical protein